MVGRVVCSDDRATDRITVGVVVGSLDGSHVGALVDTARLRVTLSIK